MTALALATWPTNRNDAFEDKWRQMANKLFAQDGVFRKTDSGSFYCWTDGISGMNVYVDSGECWMDGEFGYLDAARTTVNVGAADSTYDRLDQVVLRLDRQAPATIFLDIVPGTPSANPVVTPLANSSRYLEMAIGIITVGHGVTTIAANKVVQSRNFIGSNGGWKHFDFQLYQGDGGGTVPTITTDPISNHAVSEYKLIDDLCFIRWGQNVLYTGTPGYQYIVSVPLVPYDEWDQGSAVIQNCAGSAFTIPDGYDGGSLHNGIAVSKNELDQVIYEPAVQPLHAGGPVYDRFTICYRVADDKVRSV